MARAAQRRIMEALDRAQAVSLRVADSENVPPVMLPHASLELIARLLGLMSEGSPVSLVPTKAELTMAEAAEYLNVSRPFVIREIEAGRLPCREFGARRRIMLGVLIEYAKQMRAKQDAALDRLAQEAQDLGLDA